MRTLNRIVRSNVFAVIGLVFAAAMGAVFGLAHGIMLVALLALTRTAALDPRLVAGRAGDYFDQCLPTLAEAPDASGRSLTRFNTHALTPEEFVADGISENLRHVYGSMATAIMRGYQPNHLDAIIFGRARDYSMHLQMMKRGRQSLMQPFVTLPKEDVVNTGAFVITDGEAGGDEDYDWQVTIENGNADFQNQDLPAIDTQFVAGDTVVVFFTGEDGSSNVRHMEVVTSEDATYGGTPAATVVLRAPYLQAQWDALTTPEKATWHPTGGLVMFAGNSTSNYRARCNQKGLYNSRSLAHYWFQTVRKMFQWTDEFEKVNNAETMSEFFKAFERIPLGEQIKQLDVDYMRSLANDLFWGQPYAGQDVETWQTSGNLPQVFDLDGTTVMDVETRLKGYETQLDECGRVIDLAGAPLSVDQLKELLPILARNRAGTGAARDQVWDVDMLVNPTVSGMLQKVMAAVYRDEWGVQYTEDIRAKETNDRMNQKGVWANTYNIPGVNLRLNVISGLFLDDLSAMAPVGHKTAANYALFPDFTDVDWFIMESKKRTVEWPPRNIPIEETKCVIDFDVRTIKLESTTHGLAVKRPARHLLVKGFSNTVCPIYTPQICTSYEG
jgi:hypothetical protein